MYATLSPTLSGGGSPIGVVPGASGQEQDPCWGRDYRTTPSTAIRTRMYLHAYTSIHTQHGFRPRESTPALREVTPTLLNIQCSQSGAAQWQSSDVAHPACAFAPLLHVRRDPSSAALKRQTPGFSPATQLPCQPRWTANTGAISTWPPHSREIIWRDYCIEAGPRQVPSRVRGPKTRRAPFPPSRAHPIQTHPRAPRPQTLSLRQTLFVLSLVVV